MAQTGDRYRASNFNKFDFPCNAMEWEDHGVGCDLLFFSRPFHSCFSNVSWDCSGVLSPLPCSGETPPAELPHREELGLGEVSLPMGVELDELS